MGLFTYPATLVRVTDGDTVHLVIDIGFSLDRRDSANPAGSAGNPGYRLGRINAPELSTAEGKAAKGALENYLAAKALTVQTFKADSFGRYIVEIWADGANVSDWLVTNGYAVYKTY